MRIVNCNAIILALTRGVRSDTMLDLSGKVEHPSYTYFIDKTIIETNVTGACKTASYQRAALIAEDNLPPQTRVFQVQFYDLRHPLF